jgi:hypothetical protein
MGTIAIFTSPIAYVLAMLILKYNTVYIFHMDKLFFQYIKNYINRSWLRFWDFGDNLWHVKRCNI